jgi:predicted dinucleotide-utilizing enzyme
MLKIGVVGAGHLGKIHLKILKESSFIDLMGFYDINDDVSKQVTTSLDVKSFESLDDLIKVWYLKQPFFLHYLFNTSSCAMMSKLDK